MTFQIESTSFCMNGMAPRWSWWIHGIRDSRRFGVVGTDAQGRGLYLFEPNGDHKPHSVQLLNPDKFSLPHDLSKKEASSLLVAALESLGWQAKNPAKA